MSVRQQTKLARLQAKMQRAQARGQLRKVAKFERRIARLQARVSARGAVAGFAGLGIGFAAAGRVGLTVKKTYSVQLDSGAIKYTAPSGRIVTLGYTPAKAKKMYRTKRRRKRLTTRDKAIIAAIQANPQAAASLSLMM